VAKTTAGQKAQTHNSLTADIPFEVEEIEIDPTRKGYTQVPNYFAYYWTPLLGAKAALTYERICSFAHGKKSDCYPSVRLLADILACDRHDLTGRIRRDSRPGRRREYYQKGLLQHLADSRLVGLAVEERNGGVSYRFQVFKSPPLLTDAQVAQLPVRLQRKHQELLDRCRQEREEFMPPPPAQESPREQAQPQNIIMEPLQGGDGVTGLTSQGTKKINTTLTLAVIPDDLAAQKGVETFYHHIGQDKVSRQALNAGVKIVADLKSQGYSLVDILWVMSWITTHPQQFGGQVRSINLVPLVIGYVLQQKTQPLMTGIVESPDKQAPNLDLLPDGSTQPGCSYPTTQVPTTNRSALSPEERQRLAAYHRQQERYRQQEQEHQASLTHQQECQRLFQTLTSTQQEALREVAVKSLLDRGIKQAYLLDVLVWGEVYRLLREKQLTTASVEVPTGDIVQTA
jgi:hypothetical protein